MTETDVECAKQDEPTQEAGTVEIFIMGKRSEVPVGFTIMKAIE